MSRIMFFCIPAHGHTNPTLPVVAELVRRGHQVRYYSFHEFEEKIRATGAQFIACDDYLPPVSQKEMQKLMKVSITEMTVTDFETTARIDPMLAGDVREFQPDCIVADSVCFWGKLTARKYKLPFVCSTTTFAFNQYSSRYMKNSPHELLDMILGMPRVNRALRRLRPLGYNIKSALSITQNDNDTNTIVYTSKQFQPCADTFSDRYAFIGPAVKDTPVRRTPGQQPLVYISLGTVINNRPDFYKSCIAALKAMDVKVVISCGKYMDPAKLGSLPSGVTAYPYVNQMEVLSRADVFITHCGMNSVSESLYMGVPMVLAPQSGEEFAVARRTEEVGAGKMLAGDSPDEIRAAVSGVLSEPRYAEAAARMRADFLACSGAAGGADFIESVI